MWEVIFFLQPMYVSIFLDDKSENSSLLNNFVIHRTIRISCGKRKDSIYQFWVEKKKLLLQLLIFKSTCEHYTILISTQLKAYLYIDMNFQTYIHIFASITMNFCNNIEICKNVMWYINIVATGKFFILLKLSLSRYGVSISHQCTQQFNLTILRSHL